MNAPRSARDALLAELLGDIDVLLKRTESLPDQILDAESKIKNTVALIDAAGDRYRLAVTAFNEEAKKDLSEFADRKIQIIQQASIKLAEEHQAFLKAQSQQSNFNDTNRFAEEIAKSVNSKLNVSGLKKADDSFRKIRETAMGLCVLLVSCALTYFIATRS